MAQLTGRRFTYAVSENKDTLAVEIGHMEKFKKPTSEFEEYSKKLEEFNKKWAEKDAGGNPKVKKIPLSPTRATYQYVIPGINDQHSEYALALTEFNKPYLKVIKEQEEKEREYEEEFLEEPANFSPFMIDLDDVPDSIPQPIMDRIKFMIRKIDNF